MLPNTTSVKIQPLQVKIGLSKSANNKQQHSNNIELQQVGTYAHDYTYNKADYSCYKTTTSKPKLQIYH